MRKIVSRIAKCAKEDIAFRIILFVELAVMGVLFLRCIDKDVHREIICDAAKEYEAGEDNALGSCMSLKPSLYRVSVYYDEDYDNDGIMNDCRKSNGVLRIRDDYDNFAIKNGTLNLSEDLTYKESRMWITGIGTLEKVRVFVNYDGNGSLFVSKVSIDEIGIWKYTVFISVLLLFMLIDALYYLFFIDNKIKDKYVIACLLFMTIFVSFPMFTDFLPEGHDIRFHLNRILEIADKMQNNAWGNPLQTNTLNGYSFATSLFYGQTLLYVPAFLYTVGFSLQSSYQLSAIALNLLACLICYFCFKGIVKRKDIALFGAFIFVSSPYRLCDLYVKAAIGEYLGATFIPLVIYGFYRVYTKPDNEKIGITDYFPIVLGLTAIIQSHVLTCEMLAIFIIFTCLVLYKKTFVKTRFAALLKALAAAIIANLNFIVPFIDSARMPVHVFNMETNSIEFYGVYLPQMFNMFFSPAGGGQWGMRLEMPLSLGIGLTAGLFMGMYCYKKRVVWGTEKEADLKFSNYCMLLMIISLFFCSIYMPWDSLMNKLLPFDSSMKITRELAFILNSVQFPFRYYSIAIAVGCFSFVVSVKCIYDHCGMKTFTLLCALITGLVFISDSSFFMNAFYTNTEIKIYSGNNLTSMDIGHGEYFLPGTDTEQLYIREVVSEDGVEVEDYAYKNGITDFYCSNESADEKTVTIPLFNYYNYHAYDSQGNELAIENGENNKISIVIPGNYEGSVSVRYKMPLLWIVVKIISPVFVIYSVFMYLKALKKTPWGIYGGKRTFQ